jgi:hypothetical protein
MQIVAREQRDKPLCMAGFVLLQVVLQSQPGSLYISLVDDSAGSSSGSSSGSSIGSSIGSSDSSSSADGSSDSSSGDAAYFIDILQLLLAPLQTPLLVTHGNSQHDDQDSSIDKHMVKARNLAIHPFFGSKPNAQRCRSDTSSTSDQDMQQVELVARMDGSAVSSSDSSSSSSSDNGVLGLVQDTQHLLQHDEVGRDQETGAVVSSSSSSSGKERRRLLQQQRQRAGRALKSRWVEPGPLDSDNCWTTACSQWGHLDRQ